MSAQLSSIKLPTDLVDDARRESNVMSRSIAGQVEHWARLGQTLEALPGFTSDRVRAALEGRMNVDDLSDDEWELFHDQLFAEPSAAEIRAFAALGLQAGAVGVDDSGNVVRVSGSGVTEAAQG
ncbi:MAG: hypothetical protein ING59_07785 [Burkholderiales bacterium]|jgi:hypothetical protein|nr:hypothetical protein [Burkholderiales bacterium]